MKDPKPKYAAHGEPGTEAWIEVYADTCHQAEERHKVYAHAPELHDALKALWGFVEDLQSSNPGYLRNLVLKDYAQLNESLIKTPAVLAKLP